LIMVLHITYCRAESNRTPHALYLNPALHNHRSIRTQQPGLKLCAHHGMSVARLLVRSSPTTVARSLSERRRSTR